MSKKTTNHNINVSYPLRIIIGLLLSSVIGILFTLLVSVLFSYLLSNSEMISGYSVIYLIFSIIIGGFICGYIGTLYLPFRGIVSGLFSSVLYTIIIFLLLFIFSKGNLSPYSLLLIFITILSSSIGGITNVNRKRRK